MTNIHTAPCQPAEVNIVIQDLFTLNQQEDLKGTLKLM